MGEGDSDIRPGLDEIDTYDLREELDLLDPAAVRLSVDEFQDLSAVIDGEVSTRVSVVRAFPISSSEQFVIFKDRDGRELGTIRDISALDDESRQVLEAELERTYFNTQITRINSISAASGRYHVPEWDVETNRGQRVFEIQSSRRDIRSLGGGRVLILDADGNRYEIPDYRRLEPLSRTLIENQV